MAEIKLDLTVVAGFNDDLNLEILMFQGDSDASCYTGILTIDDIVDEYITVRKNYRTGIIEDRYVGDADVLAQKLRNAADALTRAVMRYEEEQDASA